MLLPRLISLFLFTTASVFASDDCSLSPAAVKFVCTDYNLFTNKDSRIEVTIPEGSPCDQAPESGSILNLDSQKSRTIYQPRVKFYFLRDKQKVAFVTYGIQTDSSKVLETVCTDIEMIH